MVLGPHREDSDVGAGDVMLDPLDPVKPGAAGERPIGRTARTAGERAFEITMAGVR